MGVMSREYQQWVRDYQDQAWSLARYLLKDASEAEDATQEAFIKLWHHRENVDPERIKPWLMKVTRNTCLDRLRRRKHRYHKALALASVGVTLKVNEPEQAPAPAAPARSEEGAANE